MSPIGSVIFEKPTKFSLFFHIFICFFFFVTKFLKSKNQIDKYIEKLVNPYSIIFLYFIYFSVYHHMFIIYYPIVLYILFNVYFFLSQNILCFSSHFFFINIIPFFVTNYFVRKINGYYFFSLAYPLLFFKFFGWVRVHSFVCEVYFIHWFEFLIFIF